QHTWGENITSIYLQCVCLRCENDNNAVYLVYVVSPVPSNLTDISLIASFPHLRFVDISSNFLDSLTPLEALPHLLWLRAESCGLRSVILQNQWPYLQWLSLARNKISASNGLSHPHLKTLFLNGNHDMLEFMWCYTASNKTIFLEGLKGLKHLSYLHLRDNRVSNLDGFVQENPEDEILPSLYYLNLRYGSKRGYKRLRSDSSQKGGSCPTKPLACPMEDEQGIARWVRPMRRRVARRRSPSLLKRKSVVVWTSVQERTEFERS
uniref:Leucine rich repeat containing 23 n=1 Tax=Eptatretus burgeri TaxID=7764 RepID=A0A8C4QYX3_EPTBU